MTFKSRGLGRLIVLNILMNSTAAGETTDHVGTSFVALVLMLGCGEQIASPPSFFEAQKKPCQIALKFRNIRRKTPASENTYFEEHLRSHKREIK